MCREALGAEQEIILSPLLKIELLPFEAPVTPYHGLIFTSDNGVRAFAQVRSPQRIPAYCVGDRTADAARAAGLEAFSAKGSADDLVTMINATDVAGPMLHIRGEHTRGDIAKRISAQVDEVVCYRQTPLPLTDETRTALQGNREVILPVFSPRTAQIFFEQVKTVSASLQMVAMSEAVNDVILGSNLAENVEISIAETPDAWAMIQAIKRCIETI